MTPMRTLLALLFLTAPFALAQVCSAELAALLADSTTPDHVSGVEAVRVFRSAIELIEPALPRMVVGGEPNLARGEPGYDDALFLLERRLLPGGWQPGELSRAVWQEMSRRFLAWYGLDPLLMRDPLNESVFLGDVTEVLALASEAVRPAALIAVDPDDRERISFWALIWNWTVFPRLIVLRPLEGVSLANGVEAVLPLLGSCAVHPTSYVFAPEQTATRLFQSSNAAQMVIVGAAPLDENRWPYWVAEGDELTIFGFAHSAVSDLDSYSAVFVGPTVSPVTLLRLLPQVRTNLSPRGFFRYMETP